MEIDYSHIGDVYVLRNGLYNCSKIALRGPSGETHHKQGTQRGNGNICYFEDNDLLTLWISYAC